MADGKLLGERLIASGLIAREALAQALELQKSSPGIRVGDCLLSLRLISEQALLRFLAAEFETRYVTAEKLSKVKVGAMVLDQVPVRFAESQLIFPILFDEERRCLSVVMAEPQNVAAIEELKIVANLADAVVFVGTRASLVAAIRRHYYGDPAAFEDLNPLKDPRALPLAAELAPAGSQAPSGLAEPQAPLPPQSQRSAADALAPGGSAGLTSLGQAVNFVQRSTLTSDNDFVETLNVLVGLLELRRKDAFRAHSAAVAKHSRVIAQRMGLSPREINHVTVAAYLHDLGKRPDRHLTLLATAASPEWKADARRYYRAPIRLFETVHLPVEVNAILAQLYEAWDGSGLPQGVKAEAIPAGSRILAAVDAYQDLTRNAQNVFQRLFPKEEALARLRDQVGVLFDPMVLDLMEQIHSGEILRERLSAEGRQVLICHTDEGMRTDLRDALSKLGLLATATGNAEGVLEALRHGEADLFICEANLEPDAFAILAALRREPSVAGLPAIVLTGAQDAAVSERAAGLRPCEVLPQSEPDPIAARAKELYDRRLAAGAPGRRVSGSLDEMGVADLLRTLASVQRSGRLTFRSHSLAGELRLEKGRVVHAVCGSVKGEEALDRLLGIGDGDFTYDPNFLVLEQQMDKDAEVLVRESEARHKRGGAPPRPSPASPSGKAIPTFGK
jgi:response regulator RpfG family c-di-GMP phosphodiesterase